MLRWLSTAAPAIYLFVNTYLLGIQKQWVNPRLWESWLKVMARRGLEYCRAKTNCTWYFEHFVSVLFLYVTLYVLSLLSLHLQKVKFRKGYYSSFITIYGTCLGKWQDRDNLAQFASATTLHMWDFKALFSVSVGIVNNRSGPQFICWKFQQMRCN